MIPVVHKRRKMFLPGMTCLILLHFNELQAKGANKFNYARRSRRELPEYYLE